MPLAMRSLLASAAALTLLLVAAPAHAKGAFVPPLRFDVGSLAINSDTEILTGTEMLIGIHWASIHPGSPKFDIGVGFVSTFTELPDALVLGGRRMDSDGFVTANGGYLELATRLAGGDHWRTWLSGRGEMSSGSLGGQRFSSLGGATRITTELFAGVAGSGGNGIMFGSFAIGLYVEAAHRQLPANIGQSGFGGGLTLRLPLILVGD